MAGKATSLFVSKHLKSTPQKQRARGLLQILKSVSGQQGNYYACSKRIPETLYGVPFPHEHGHDLFHSALADTYTRRLLLFSLYGFFRRSSTQDGLALDPKNNGLEASLAAAKEAQETDRRERWRQAALERESEEERRKMQNAAKAKAKSEAAEAAAAAAGTAETNASGDPLSSFFSELEGEREKAPPLKAERILHDEYTNQDLGTPQEQMDRLLQHNYKWKNLNAFEALQLGHDATVEDIKQRYHIYLL